FSSRRRHTRFSRDWSSDVCSSDLPAGGHHDQDQVRRRGAARRFRDQQQGRRRRELTAVRRRTSERRPDWKAKIEQLGLVFGTPARNPDGSPRPYWDEGVHYEFGLDEVLALEADVELLQAMCLEAVDHVVTTERYQQFAIPEWAWPHVAESWKRHDPHLYGRFDLRYDGSGPAKLLEHNADT